MSKKLREDKHIPFFDLISPSQLFEKLKADLVTLEETHESQAAFNFFVTAEHLPDWLRLRHLVKQNAALRVVSDIASGAKHFLIDSDRHKSVRAAEKDEYFAEDYVENGYVAPELVIHLEDFERESLQLPLPQISAVELGKMVVDFWQSHIK